MEILFYTFLSLPTSILLQVADYVDLNDKLQELSQKYQISPTALSVAWILRHSAHMQPIAGTTSLAHLEDICQATSIEMSREDWYSLYLVDRQLP